MLNMVVRVLISELVKCYRLSADLSPTTKTSSPL